MKKSRTIRTIAVLMAFILILTSSNLDVVRANGMDATQEVSGSIASEESATTDKVSYAIDGDTFLRMLSDAQRQAPIQNLFDVFGYESQELNNQLLLENTDLYLVGEPMIQDQYRVFTFLQKEKGGTMKVVFFTENTTEDMINAELNVEVGCLEEVSSNEVVEYSLVEVMTGEQKIEEPETEKPVVEEPAVGEPTVASESAITMLSVGEPLEMLNEAPLDTDKEVVEETAEVTKPEAPNEAPEVTKPETIEETPEVPKQETPEEVTEETKQETEQKQESLITTVNKTALLSVFSISNTEIAPTINKAAILDSNSGDSVDYDVTLTVNGASKTSSTTTTQLADVIFVVDISNSMDENMGDDTRWGKLQTAMDGMVTTLLPAGSQNRISIVAYGGSNKTQYSDFNVLLSKSSDANVTKSIYNKSLSQMRQSVFGTEDYYNGGTNSKAGFIGALKELQELRSTSADRNQYVIYLSDGVPTFYKNYYNEYLNGQFLDTCTYNSISSSGGDGSSYTSDGARQAINVARRINREYPNAAIYTIGIGATSQFESYILNTNNYANGGFNKTYKSADSAAELQTVFAALTQTVNTSTTLTNLAAQDQLSAYVDLNEASPIVVNGNPIEPTVNSQNENQIDYIRDNVVVASFNKETKTINWIVADSLGEGQTSTLTYSVHTTDEAIAYEDTYKGKENCYQGTENSGTHASNNGKSEDTQYGYRSNVNAFVTYMDEDESGTVTFNHPVVQSVVKGTLTINKQLDKTYAGLSSDTLYSFNVTLESAELTEDTMTHITFSADRLHTTPAFADGKVTFTVQLKATESISVGNLPTDTQYTITETLDGFNNPYYEMGGFSVTGNEGSNHQVNESTRTVTGTLKKTGIQGKQSYDLISYEKEDATKRWYNADIMAEIIDNDLLTELIQNKTLKSESAFVLGKEIAGIWTAGIEAADLAKTATNGYEDSNGNWIWAVEASTQRYVLNPKTTTTVYVNTAGTEVTPADTRDVYYYLYWGETRSCYKSNGKYYDSENGNRVYSRVYQIYEYQTSGTWRDCYKSGSYYFDWLNESYVSSSGVKEKQEGLVNGTWITVRQIQRTIPAYYEYNGAQYTTKENLRNALDVAASSVGKLHITYDDDTTVVYITFDTSYASEEAYLIAEKSYYKVKTATYTSFVEDFFFTGACTELTFINSMALITGTIGVTKKLDKADGLDANTFIFRLENTDVNSPAYGMVAYRSVNLDSSVLSSSQIVFENIPMGTYQVTEEDNMNYDLDSITNGGIVLLEKVDRSAAIEVKNKKTSGGGFTDSSVAENEGTKTSTIISYIKKFVR